MKENNMYRKNACFANKILNKIQIIKYIKYLILLF